jgi:hypothetical protein
MDFFLSGEVTCLKLSLSFGVSGFVHIFSQWDEQVGKGDLVVERASLIFFKNCSLITCLGETCRYCAT